MFLSFLVLLVSLYNVQSLLIDADDLIVSLPDGQIQGTRYNLNLNKSFYGFQGIPFAEPPIGELRFEPPKPKQPWQGVWDATNDRNSCISIGTSLEFLLSQDEDCLYINVYVPEVFSNKSSRNLPVMFWIYGGGFTQGTSNKQVYGPDFLVEKDVIFVSFNYRLGPFGFLSTLDQNLPGNMGLKDQLLALKWTKDNIAYFGGDPEKITIFGESAGGASVGLHLVSKQSAGLFRSAIVQSGSALVNWAIDQFPKAKALALANIIGVGNLNDTMIMKQALKNVTSQEIVEGQNALPDGYAPHPVIEPEGDNAFITHSPYELLSTGEFNQVPIVIGICAEESLYLLKNLDNAKDVARTFDETPFNVIPTNLQPNVSDETAVENDVKNIYLDNNQTWTSNLAAFAHYNTDNYFARGVLKQAVLSSKFVPVYLYQFAYYNRTILSQIDGRDIGTDRASHGAEIPFLFNVILFSSSTYPEDLLAQERIVTLWTNWAKFLNPTPEKSDLFDNLSWTTLKNNSSAYFNLNSTVELRSNLKGNTVSKWDAIFDTYGAKPFITY